MSPLHGKQSKNKSLVKSSISILIFLITCLSCIFFNISHAYNIQFREGVQTEGDVYKGIGWEFDGYAVAGERIKLGDRIEMYLQVKETLKELDISPDVELDIIIDSNYANNGTHEINGTAFKHKGRYQIYLRKKSRVTAIHEIGHVYQRHFGVSIEKYMKYVYNEEYEDSTIWHEKPSEKFAEDFVKYIIPTHIKRTVGKCDSEKFSEFIKKHGI